MIAITSWHRRLGAQALGVAWTILSDGKVSFPDMCYKRMKKYWEHTLL